MKEPAASKTPFLSAWSALELLLLASAINRHGTNNWSLITGELMCRAKFIGSKRPSHYTEEVCRECYDFLKGQYSSLIKERDEVHSVFVAELRKESIAQLQRDRRQVDETIITLKKRIQQLKVLSSQCTTSLSAREWDERAFTLELKAEDVGARQRSSPQGPLTLEPLDHGVHAGAMAAQIPDRAAIAELGSHGGLVSAGISKEHKANGSEERQHGTGHPPSISASAEVVWTSTNESRDSRKGTDAARIGEPDDVLLRGDSMPGPVAMDDHVSGLGTTREADDAQLETHLPFVPFRMRGSGAQKAHNEAVNAEAIKRDLWSDLAVTDTLATSMECDDKKLASTTAGKDAGLSVGMAGGVVESRGNNMVGDMVAKDCEAGTETLNPAVRVSDVAQSMKAVALDTWEGIPAEDGSQARENSGTMEISTEPSAGVVASGSGGRQAEAHEHRDRGGECCQTHKQGKDKLGRVGAGQEAGGQEGVSGEGHLGLRAKLWLTEEWGSKDDDGKNGREGGVGRGADLEKETGEGARVKVELEEGGSAGTSMEETDTAVGERHFPGRDGCEELEKDGASVQGNYAEANDAAGLEIAGLAVSGMVNLEQEAANGSMAALGVLEGNDGEPTSSSQADVKAFAKLQNFGSERPIQKDTAMETGSVNEEELHAALQERLDRGMSDVATSNGHFVLTLLEGNEKVKKGGGEGEDPGSKEPCQPGLEEILMGSEEGLGHMLRVDEGEGHAAATAAAAAVAGDRVAVNEEDIFEDANESMDDMEAERQLGVEALAGKERGAMEQVFPGVLDLNNNGLAESASGRDSAGEQRFEDAWVDARPDGKSQRGKEDTKVSYCEERMVQEAAGGGGDGGLSVVCTTEGLTHQKVDAASPDSLLRLLDTVNGTGPSAEARMAEVSSAEGLPSVDPLQGRIAPVESCNAVAVPQEGTIGGQDSDEAAHNTPQTCMEEDEAAAGPEAGSSSRLADLGPPAALSQSAAIPSHGPDSESAIRTLLPAVTFGLEHRGAGLTFAEEGVVSHDGPAKVEIARRVQSPKAPLGRSLDLNPEPKFAVESGPELPSPSPPSPALPEKPRGGSRRLIEAKLNAVGSGAMDLLRMAYEDSTSVTDSVLASSVNVACASVVSSPAPTSEPVLFARREEELAEGKGPVPAGPLGLCTGAAFEILEGQGSGLATGDQSEERTKEGEERQVAGLERGAVWMPGFQSVGEGAEMGAAGRGAEGGFGAEGEDRGVRAGLDDDSAGAREEREGIDAGAQRTAGEVEGREGSSIQGERVPGEDKIGMSLAGSVTFVASPKYEVEGTPVGRNINEGSEFGKSAVGMSGHGETKSRCVEDVGQEALTDAEREVAEQACEEAQGVGDRKEASAAVEHVASGGSDRGQLEEDTCILEHVRETGNQSAEEMPGCRDGGDGGILGDGSSQGGRGKDGAGQGVGEGADAFDLVRERGAGQSRGREEPAGVRSTGRHQKAEDREGDAEAGEMGAAGMQLRNQEMQGGGSNAAEVPSSEAGMQGGQEARWDEDGVTEANRERAGGSAGIARGQELEEEEEEEVGDGSNRLKGNREEARKEGEEEVTLEEESGSGDRGREGSLGGAQDTEGPEEGDRREEVRVEGREGGKEEARIGNRVEESKQAVDVRNERLRVEAEAGEDCEEELSVMLEQGKGDTEEVEAMDVDEPADEVQSEGAEEEGGMGEGGKLDTSNLAMEKQHVQYVRRNRKGKRKMADAEGHLVGSSKVDEAHPGEAKAARLLRHKRTKVSDSTAAAGGADEIEEVEGASTEAGHLGQNQDDRFSLAGAESSKAASLTHENEESTSPSRSHSSEVGVLGPEQLLLLEVLRKVRAHQFAPLFQQHFDPVEFPNYERLVRQHVDLSLIRRRIHEGAYSWPRHFVRDVLLLFSNAMVFFPPVSQEHNAAVTLREYALQVMKEVLKDDAGSLSIRVARWQFPTGSCQRGTSGRTDTPTTSPTADVELQRSGSRGRGGAEPYLEGRGQARGERSRSASMTTGGGVSVKGGETSARGVRGEEGGRLGIREDVDEEVATGTRVRRASSRTGNDGQGRPKRQRGGGRARQWREERGAESGEQEDETSGVEGRQRRSGGTDGSGVRGAKAAGSTADKETERAEGSAWREREAEREFKTPLPRQPTPDTHGETASRTQPRLPIPKPPRRPSELTPSSSAIVDRKRAQAIPGSGNSLTPPLPARQLQSLQEPDVETLSPDIGTPSVAASKTRGPSFTRVTPDLSQRLMPMPTSNSESLSSKAQVSKVQVEAPSRAQASRAGASRELSKAQPSKGGTCTTKNQSKKGQAKAGTSGTSESSAQHSKAVPLTPRREASQKSKEPSSSKTSGTQKRKASSSRAASQQKKEASLTKATSPKMKKVVSSTPVASKKETPKQSKGSGKSKTVVKPSSPTRKRKR